MKCFLSYNSKDIAYARQLLTILREQHLGLDVYFAERDIEALFWQEQMAEAIESAHGVLLLVGPSGIGKWQFQEYQFAYNLLVDKGLPTIVPVVLTEELPRLSFLRNLHIVRTTLPFTQSTAATLVQSLKGEEDRSVEQEIWRYMNPYQGLSALREQDGEYFFGREADIGKVLSLISDNERSVVSFIGNSGVGKSSLVQAGVIASLKLERAKGGGLDEWPRNLEGSRNWGFITVTPGTQPVRALALSFVALWQEDMNTARRFELADSWERRLLANQNLSDLIDVTFERLTAFYGKPPQRLVVYIDQGEELYSRSSRESRRVFSNIVRNSISDDRLTILHSIRADYYGHLIEDDALNSVVKKIDVAPLRRSELELVIKSPAAMLGCRFENDGIVQELIEAVTEQPGALPLLSYLMTEIWQRMQKRGDGVLQLNDRDGNYRVSTILSKKAEEFYEKNANHADTLRRIFTLRLAFLPSQGEPVRRRVQKDDCSPDEWRLIEKMASNEWRLLVTGQENDLPSAEVAHEILLREWPRLKEWFRDERDFLVWKGQLESARRQWESVQVQEKDDALLSGLSLRIAENWLSLRGSDLSAADVDFVNKSVQRRQVLQDAEEARKLQEEERKRKEEESRQQYEDRIAKAQKERMRWVYGTIASVGVVFFAYLFYVSPQTEQLEGIRKKNECKSQKYNEIRNLLKKSLPQCASNEYSRYLKYQLIEGEPTQCSDGAGCRPTDCVDYERIC